MDLSTLWERLARETVREPVFERYPSVRLVADAVEIALERIEEWEYTADPHGWCHERPVLIALVAGTLQHMGVVPDDPSRPPKPKLYLCWCDGSACDGRTSVPFTPCADCLRWGHRPLPHDEMTPDMIEVEN